MRVDLENSCENVCLPEFLKVDYFQDILEMDFPDLERVKNITAKAATGPGEHYNSDMFRVLFELELKSGKTVQVSYILKTELEGVEDAKVLRNMNLFPKESSCLEQILPQFEKLYLEAGEIVHFGPQCKLVDETPDRITIVMEDLKPRNFVNVDRDLGLDLKHMEHTLVKVAQFHAASAVHYERNGPYPEIFNRSFYTEKNRVFLEKINESKRTMFLEVLSHWGNCEKYMELWPTSSEYTAAFIAVQDPNPNELSVLNHGDCWSNNVMFQYDKHGNINESYFVDFQLCKWGSPAQDLYYVITNSAAHDIKINDFDLFLRIYQENLAKNLKLLGYSKQIPSLKDIHILMIKYSIWSLFAATSILPVITVDEETEGATNMMKFLTDEVLRRRCLMNPKYVKAMKQLLPWWENRGVFQFNS